MLFIAALALTVLFAVTAEGKNNKVFHYPYDSIWAAAVRLVRVDGGYRITDKDKETGYILFVYPGTGAVKQCAAALELIRTEKNADDPGVRVAINIAHQPSYIEIDLLDRLEKKLKDERGEPPPQKRSSSLSGSSRWPDRQGESGSNHTGH